MNWHEAPLAAKSCGATNSPDKTCTETDYDLQRERGTDVAFGVSARSLETHLYIFDVLEGLFKFWIGITMTWSNWHFQLRLETVLH